jgi:hypothetical protein
MNSTRFLQVVLVLGAVMALAIADAAALAAVANPLDSAWLVLASAVVVTSAYSIFAGRVIGHRKWWLLVAGPVIYYAGLSAILSSPEYLWLDLRMPLTVFAALSGGYLGAHSDGVVPTQP